MMPPSDPQGDAARLEAEYIVKQLGAMSPDLKQQFVEDFATAFWSALRGYALPDAKNYTNVRILHAGSEVTTDSTGTTVGLTGGKSQFDILNFIGGAAYIDSATNARQIDLNVGGGGADCMFNVLVSTCFSSLAGWVEGQVFTSLSGCTFKTTATPQKAMDYIRDNFSGSGTIFICKGSYNGGMHAHHDLTVDVLGAGRDLTIIYGANNDGGKYVVDSGAAVGNAAIVAYRDLTFDGTQGTAPINAVFGNPNGSICFLESCNIKIPASNNGAQFNGNDTLNDIRFIGPTSGTQATTGFTSANNIGSLHHASNIAISGCSMGMKFTNAELWNISNVFITGANAVRGDSNGAGGIAFDTSDGLRYSRFTNVTIKDSAVGLGFVNASGESNVLTNFLFENCTVAMDIRGSTTGISGWIFNAMNFVLGTAGQTGVDFTNASNGHCTYCQFTNLNFRGYASGNEIVNASGTHIGTGTCGYHNISDAGTVADFGSPLGHAGSGSGGAAVNNAAYVTIGNDSNLSAERALTAGTGVTITDAGANSTVTIATSANGLIRAINVIIDGGGSAITTGMKAYIEVPMGATITRATLLADQSGSIVVDIFKCTYAQFDAGATHPVSGDKITASAPPTISSATKAQDSTLTGWTTAITAGDILGINVNSASTVTRVTLSLRMNAT